MATVSGTLTTHDGLAYVGEVRIDNLDAPAKVGVNVVVGIHDGLRIQTDSSGRFSTVLRAGYYKFSAAAAKAFRFSVPDDGGTYQIGDIGVPALPHYTGIGVETALLVYWGKSSALKLADAAAVQALADSRSQTGIINSYEFDSSTAAEYAFICVPSAWVAPTYPNGFEISGFPAAMAGTADAYGTDELNGYWREIITVNSQSMAIYRLANPSSGAFVVTASV